MNLARTKRGRDIAARAMASENPTEFLSRRVLLTDIRGVTTDVTDRLEAGVIEAERREEEEDGSGGQVRPALRFDGTLGGNFEDFGGQLLTVWRYVDGVPHIGFVGEVETSDPGPEETTFSANTPGRWLAEINFMARTPFPGMPASAAAYAICRRNGKYRGVRIPLLSAPFTRQGSRAYAANAKLAVALEDLRKETGLVVLDRSDGTATGWVPPAFSSASMEPAVWYEVGRHIDGREIRLPKRRDGNYRDAWAYTLDERGAVVNEVRRPMERRPGTVYPPLGADYEIPLGDAEEDDSPVARLKRKTGHQRTTDAARLFSYRERDVEFPVFSDPRLERTDTVGLVRHATEGSPAGRFRVTRRYAMPVEAFSDDIITNEVVRRGYATMLSEKRAPLPRPRIEVPSLPTDGMVGGFAVGSSGVPEPAGGPAPADVLAGDERTVEELGDKTLQELST